MKAKAMVKTSNRRFMAVGTMWRHETRGRRCVPISLGSLLSRCPLGYPGSSGKRKGLSADVGEPQTWPRDYLDTALIRTWSNATANMACRARCSRSRTNVWFIDPPARAGRCHAELYDRAPRRFKVTQGPKSNTHATSCLLQLQAIGMHGFVPLATLSRSPTAGARAVPLSLKPISTSSAVGTVSGPMTEHGAARSVIQGQSVA